jgi:hypothetical protein
VATTLRTYCGARAFEAFLAALLVLCCVNAHAQPPDMSGASAPGTPEGAHGALTVTATVVTSVALVIGPDGEQRIILANAPDPADNVSRVQPVIVVQLTPVTDSKTDTPPKERKKKQ